MKGGDQSRESVVAEVDWLLRKSLSLKKEKKKARESQILRVIYGTLLEVERSRPITTRSIDETVI